MRRTRQSFNAILGLIMLLLPALAVKAAPPGLPAVFYGTVEIRDSQVPSGSLVRAYVGDREFGRAVVQQNASLGSVYLLKVRADDPDTGDIEGGRDGDAVTFAVELFGESRYTMVQARTWQGGTAVETNLSSHCYLTLPLIMVGY